MGVVAPRERSSFHFTKAIPNRGGGEKRGKLRSPFRFPMFCDSRDDYSGARPAVALFDQSTLGTSLQHLVLTAVELLTAE